MIFTPEKLKTKLNHTVNMKVTLRDTLCDGHTASLYFSITYF